MGLPPSSRLPRVTRSLIAAILVLPVALTGCFGIGESEGGPGDWGREFLSDSEYTRLIVEIDHEQGAAPADEALAGLRTSIESYLRKPGGVEIRTPTSEVPNEGQGAKWSFSEIRSTEDSIRDATKDGKTAVLYIMYVNGGSSEDTDSGRVLGAAYSGSSIVMFKENIRSVRNQCLNLPIGCPSSGTIEKAVLIHELGHILGLVNNGIPMVEPHEDPDHPHHSDNPDSVMYWKVDTGSVIDLIRGRGLPTEFDADDKADMRAAGGK